MHNCGLTQSCVTNDDAVGCTAVRYRLLLHGFLLISFQQRGQGRCDGAADGGEGG